MSGHENKDGGRLRWRADVRATREEGARALPGDHVVPEPDLVIMNGISIDAPPAHVWPWLAQMGSGRAGWYAYDVVDNDSRPSAATIVPALQDIRVGDVLPSLPGATDSFVVAAVQPGQDLVLAVPAAHGKTGVSWEFFLEPRGPSSTRLLVRGRVSKEWPSGLRREPAPKPARPIEYVYKLLAKMPRRAMFPIALLGHGAMQARQLRGIKRRAEAQRALRRRRRRQRCLTNSTTARLARMNHASRSTAPPQADTSLLEEQTRHADETESTGRKR